MTTGVDGKYKSNISPIFPDIQPDDILDSTRIWLPPWSSVELSQMQKDDQSRHFFRENKMKSA